MLSRLPPPKFRSETASDRFSYACVATGLLLLFAAAMKAWDLSTEPDWHATGTLHAATKVAILQYELLLSLWLLSGRWAMAASFVGANTFLCFSLFSFYQGLMNEPSCGCFGRAQLNPWMALVLDVAAWWFLLAAFLRRRRNADSLNARRWSVEGCRALRKAVAIGGGVVLILTVLAIASIATKGSPRAAIASLRGERASAVPPLVDLGRGDPGALL